MLVAAIALSFFACVDRGDPTSPSTSPGASDDVTISVRLPASSVEVGYDLAAAATATNTAGQPVQIDSIEWSSSDTSVILISNGGLVRAKKSGAAHIYAKWHKRSGQGTLAVTDTVPSKVVVSPASASEAVGSHVQLAAAVYTRTGKPLPTHAVKWSSTNASVISVSSEGIATGLKTGGAQVIAQASTVADTASLNIAAAAIHALSVSPVTSTVASGQSTQLSALASDDAGNQLTGRAVAWTTSDESVASVSTGGVVTGGKVGDATITATAEGVRATAAIHVSAGSAKTVTITPGSIGLVAGKTQQLSASLKDDAGNALAATGVTWSTSSSGIATISSTGLVTGVHAGSATITASAFGSTGNATVVVSAGAIKTITITPTSFSLVAGATRQLDVSLLDVAGNDLTGQAVSWSSSNSSVGTVSSSGLVSAAQAGSATITAAAGGASVSASLTVTAGSISSISITPGSASMVAGGTQQLTASLKDASGNAISGQTVSWSTSNAGVATVSSAGLATAVMTGTATITASASGKSATAAISVAAGAVNSISITPASGAVQQGKTLQLSATYFDVSGNTVTGQGVTWTSASSSVAAVSSTGIVTGVAVGSTSITVASNGKTKSAAITVTAATGSAPPPPPPPAPAPPPPPPPPVQTACADIAHTRLVSVSNGSQLATALSGARAGDLIQMADGSYTGGEFRLSVGGSSSQRITVCGSANAVINAGSGNDGMKLSDANYATLSGFTIAGGLFGVWVNHSTNVVLQGLTIHAIGQEGIELSNFSANAQILGNKIYDTGRSVAEYGEAIYVGSANAKWAALTAGQPDGTDNVIIDGNIIGPDVRAEHVDAKEGTHNGIIRNNTFNGAGMIESQGSGESGWPNSWVILQGVGYQVYNNTGSNALSAGFRVVTHGTVQTGTGNVFYNNKFDVDGASYGFLIQTGSSSQGNVVQCNNSVQDASKAMSNVSCQ